MFVAAPGGGERRVGSVWRGAVRITGADFAALANRVEQQARSRAQPPSPECGLVINFA